MPDREQAIAANNRLDAELTGANPIDVMIQFPKGASLYAPETLQTIAQVHAIVERQAGVGNVWSLETLRRAFGQTATAQVDVLDDAMRIEVHLPWILAALTGKIQGILKSNAEASLRIWHTPKA